MHKHQQMRKRKLERRKRRVGERHSRPGFESQAGPEYGNAEDWEVPEAQQKMSDVLTDLVEPLLEELPEPTTLKHYQGLLTLGFAAWNVSRFPPDERQKRREEVLQVAVSSLKLPAKESEEILDWLLERALTRYPDLRRMMVDFAVTELPDGEFYLQVVSTWLDSGESAGSRPAAVGEAASSTRPPTRASLLSRFGAAPSGATGNIEGYSSIGKLDMPCLSPSHQTSP